jgi:hypothetical protein
MPLLKRVPVDLVFQIQDLAMGGRIVCPNKIEDPQELINARERTLETCQGLRKIENNCVKFLRTGNHASLFSEMSTWQPDLWINRNRQATMEQQLQESV